MPGRARADQADTVVLVHAPSADIEFVREAAIRADVQLHFVRDGAELAGAVAGKLGGKVGVAPRIFLKKLDAEVLDRIDQFPDFEARGVAFRALVGPLLTEAAP